MASTSGQIVVGSGIEYLELLDALVTFLTTGLGAGNNWTVEDNTTRAFTVDGDVYLSAPGITGPPGTVEETRRGTERRKDGKTESYCRGFCGFTRMSAEKSVWLPPYRL